MCQSSYICAQAESHLELGRTFSSTWCAIAQLGSCTPGFQSFDWKHLVLVVDTRYLEFPGRKIGHQVNEFSQDYSSYQKKRALKHK